MSWDNKDVALGQRQYVESLTEKQWRTLTPYVALVDAMTEVGLASGSMLDIGCGVGYYYRVMREHFPDIQYFGIDYPPMVEQARDMYPGGQFAVGEFMDANFAGADIVLLSAVISYVFNPVIALAKARRETRGYLIWHRIRLSDQSYSYTFEEPTYAGRTAWVTLWSEDYILNHMTGRGKMVYFEKWDHDRQATAIFDCRGQHES